MSSCPPFNSLEAVVLALLLVNGALLSFAMWQWRQLRDLQAQVKEQMSPVVTMLLRSIRNRTNVSLQDFVEERQLGEMITHSFIEVAKIVSSS